MTLKAGSRGSRVRGGLPGSRFQCRTVTAIPQREGMIPNHALVASASLPPVEVMTRGLEATDLAPPRSIIPELRSPARPRRGLGSPLISSPTLTPRKQPLRL